MYIEAYNETVVRQIVADVLLSEDSSTWTVLIDTYFANNAKKVINGKVAFEIQLDSESVTGSVNVNLIPNSLNEVILHNYSIAVDSVRINCFYFTEWLCKKCVPSKIQNWPFCVKCIRQIQRRRLATLSASRNV